MKAITLYANQVSKHFEKKLSQSLETLKIVKARWQSQHITQASSLGVEDMIITHLLKQIALDCSIFVLDTGKLHQETLTLIKQAEDHFGIHYQRYTPDTQETKDFESTHGKEAMYKSVELRKTCCGIRKLKPLSCALAGKKVWITGLRQEQADSRSQVDFIAIDENYTTKDNTLYKVNPLAHWTWGDIWHFVEHEKIPYNPLHDQFFPSIGCAPCTRAVAVGEDFRAGRWWWEQDGLKECGLHVHAINQSI